MPSDGNRMDGGSTPTTIEGTPLRVSVVPIASGEASNSRTQNVWLITTTSSGPPRTISSSRGRRPASGTTPSAPKNPGEKKAAGNRRGSPRPVRSMPLDPARKNTPPMSSMSRRAARQSSRSTAETGARIDPAVRLADYTA